jgi:alpha-tubulin suppressor-like RCC1 family protein
MILFSCQLPPSPPGPENAKIDLSLRSLAGKKSNTTITDTVGNIDTIGVILYFTQYIDSTRVRVTYENDTIHSFLCKAGKSSIDTVFYPVTFSKAADFNVIATGYISGQRNSTATAVFHIVNKPLPNRAPVWSQDTVQLTGESGKLLTRELKDLCSDPDGDSLTFSLMNTALSGDTIIGSVFVVTPASTDTGKPLIHVIAKDPKGLADTVTLKLIVSGKDTTVPDTVLPEIVLQSPKIDTVIGVDSFVVKIICTDKSGIRSVQGYHDNISFTLSKPVLTENLWTGTVKGLSSGKYETIKLVVTDSSISKNKDSVSVRMKYDGDTVKPVITLISPAKDSISINSPDYTLKLKCTDTSGILSVNAVMDTMLFSGVRADSGKWTIAINGLTVNTYNSIIVTATDSSLRANKKILKLYVKYDPTLTDSIGPTIVQQSGPIHGAVIKDSIIVITDSITDPSGIDSVYWTLNNVRAGILTTVTGSPNLCRLQDTLTKFRSNRIVVHAIDKSAARNRDSAVIVFDYNLPPQINDTAVATNRNTAKTWTLGARSDDNDTLTWSRLTSPSALSGTITGTLPTVIFTPAQNWSGSDSFFVRVTDGYWSDTAKIKVSVIDVAVAPAILTQPASVTKNVGQSVTFTVVINSDVNPLPTYQWKKNGVAIPTANLSSYTIGSVSQADSGTYTVTITNSAGTITSTPVLLTINYVPSIITQPVSQVLYLGKPVTFSVVATGSPAPNYVWKKNGVIIASATSLSYTIASPGVSDSGKYTVSVSNSVGGVTSDTVKLYAVTKCVSAGANHSLFLKTDGRLYACGANNLGQLGDSSTTNRLNPVLVMTGVDTMSAGSDHSLAITKDGALWGWGNGSSGQLGDNAGFNQTKPLKITNISSVKKIAACGGYSLFLKSDGTLWACGENTWGQLGDGSKESRTTPVQVLNVNNVQSMSGSMYTLILKSDNTLWGCGYNYYGNIGDSSTINRVSPVLIKDGNNVKNISAGGGHSLFSKNDGSLWSCGYNYYGQCCDGSTSDHLLPIQVPNFTGVASVFTGQTFSMVLKTDGSLWACGSNGYGQLGNGSTNSPSSLLLVMSDVQSISAGGLFTLILKNDGSLWTCGINTNGQLGDGTTTDHSTPVQISF